MLLWRPCASLFLKEILRREGLADNTDCPSCATCGASYLPPSSNSASASIRLVRCKDCGESQECVECCMEWHIRMPLHNVQVCHYTIAPLNFYSRDTGMERAILDLYLSSRVGSRLPVRTWGKFLSISCSKSHQPRSRAFEWDPHHSSSVLCMRSF